jgi:signal transduction histidine kinase
VNSLQRLLQLGMTFSLLLLMALLWWIGNYAVRALGEDLISSRLEHDAESLLAAIAFSDSAPLKLQLDPINPIYNRPFSGHYYMIRFTDNRELSSRSLWDQSFDFNVVKVGATQQWYAPGPANQKLLVWARHYQKRGHTFTLAVAEDLTPLDKHLTVFQWSFAAFSLFVIFVMLLVQQLVIRRSFRRLDSLRCEITSLEQGEITMLSQDVPDEVQPLVEAFNQLLELLTQRLGRSRNSLGNLAHALKGPLNLLVQYLDDKALDNFPELKAEMQTQQQRIQKLMERELKRARLAGSGSPGFRFDAEQELADLVAVLKQVHRKEPLNIEWQVANNTPPFGDREDMLELMGNILDNACKWASSKVRCEITGVEEIVIAIEDDGPGCSEEEMLQLSQRGVRLDESVEGHGLGLAIAKDIVKLYNGEITFGRSKVLGGFSTTIKIRF